MPPSTRAARSAVRLRRSILLAGLAWLLVAALDHPAGRAVAADPATPPHVDVLTATGVVDNVLATYIEEGLERATRDGSSAVIVTLNTPGGSLDATQKIVTALLEAPLPTIVWVAPSGARAASAGTFITLAGHLAYMAPGTNIGAASPVGAGGEELTGTIGDKVKNDAIANIRSIAEARGRDVEWAVSTVEKAVSSTASEAVAVGAVDGIAASLEEVGSLADGRTVEVRSQPVTLDLGEAGFVDVAMNPFQSIIHLLSDPNIAFILLTIGFYGLLFELQSPNFVTGILGAIALILAFIGFGSLPLNVAGLLLIGLAVLLFVLETTVTSHGLLTVGGLVCFVLGAFTLYTAPGSPTAPDVSVALPLVVAMAAVTAGYVSVVLLTVARGRRRSLVFAGVYGAGGTMTVPPGTIGVAKTALQPVGVVHAAGEEWTAKAGGDVSILPGQSVRVVGQEDLTLFVEPGPAVAPEP
ncbi:MAG TPA: nodulation protein NfeD [Candidatus Limnocylindrales bacterium]|nr:nodulation protein NfeD [Candidatus Limnocylindrales bacterium]